MFFQFITAARHCINPNEFIFMTPGPERHAAIEAERRRIAKDLHDGLGSNFTRILLLAQRVRDGLARQEEVGTHFEKIITFARDAVQSLDEIVWAVDPGNDTTDGCFQCQPPARASCEACLKTSNRAAGLIRTRRIGKNLIVCQYVAASGVRFWRRPPPKPGKLDPGFRN